MNFIMLVLSKFRTKSLPTNRLIIRERTKFVSEQKSSKFLQFSSRQMQNDASKDKTNLTIESIRILTTANRLGRRYIQEMHYFQTELTYSARQACVCAPVHGQMSLKIQKFENIMPRRLVNVYRLTRSNVSGGLNLHQHCNEKLKPRDVLAGVCVTVLAVLLVCSLVTIVQYKYLYT
jgi:hypothetical protein